MSKKNDLARRKRQHEFELKREKEEREKKAQKLQAKKSKMKVDGSGKNKKGGFQVGKRKLKTKLTATAKAKAAQAMEVSLMLLLFWSNQFAYKNDVPFQLETLGSVPWQRLYPYIQIACRPDGKIGTSSTLVLIMKVVVESMDLDRSGCHV
ncbi:hypothetical protein ACE6H2_007776 [Prunus campanulata]